jgi:Xaa-Pro aminopeptidase
MNVPAPRLDRYSTVLHQARADAMVLTSEPAVQHATGVRLYPMRLIPQRPVACVLAPPQPPILVCVTYETDQLAARHPDLEVRPFRELGDDPWRIVADALGSVQEVIVEDTMAVTWVDSLRRHLPRAQVRPSYRLPVTPRVIKDPEEHDLLRQASHAAERAIAAGAHLVEPGRSEREVADAIVRSFLDQLSERASEVAGICAGPSNNLSMHHTATAEPIADRGPVRLGIVGRVDGYWILLTRMLGIGEDPTLADLYERYRYAYEETMATLRPGEDPRDLYLACRQRLAAVGFELAADKIGHGTGLDFREPPVISATSTDELQPGAVLAYDYAIAPVDSVMLHVEDRVLIGEDGPERLSAGWDLTDLAGGFHHL